MFKMRWVLVCLVVTICCVYAERDYEKLVQALDDASSERQFLSTIKRWFSRSGDMDKMKMQPETQAPTKTKIKYLPVYVPYPVQSPAKLPAESEYYGAYHDPMRKRDEVESIYQGVHMMPNRHVIDYYLPYSGQLPTYVKRKEYPHYYPSMQSPPVAYEVQIPNGNSHYVYDDAGYEAETEDVFADDDASEYDSEVVENAELLKSINRTTKTGGRLRKVKRKGYVPRPVVILNRETGHVPSGIVVQNPGS